MKIDTPAFYDEVAEEIMDALRSGKGVVTGTSPNYTITFTVEGTPLTVVCTNTTMTISRTGLTTAIIAPTASVPRNIMAEVRQACQASQLGYNNVLNCLIDNVRK